MKSNRLTIILDVLLILFAFVDFIFCYLEMKHLILIDKKMFENIFYKEFNPIESLTVGRNICEGENNYNPLFEYEFKGIPKKCFNGKEFIDSNNCKTPIKEIKEISISTWRDKKICIKRYKNNTYINDNKELPLFLLKQNETEIDLKYYHKCGIINAHYESKNAITKNVYMLKEGYDINTNEQYNFTCPINYFNIYKKSEINGSILNDTDYNKFELSGGYLLVVSTNITDNHLPLDFKISEGEYPCLEIERRSNKTVQFPLLNNINIFDCNRKVYKNLTDEEKKFKYDNRYRSIDTLSKEIFFKEVNLDMEYDKLPNLKNISDSTTIWENDLSNANFSMFIREYFFDNKQDPKLSNLESHISVCVNFQFWRLLASLGLIVSMIILTSAVSLMKMIKMLYHTLLFLLKQIIAYAIIGFNFYVIVDKFKDKDKIYEPYLNGYSKFYDTYTSISIKRYEIASHYSIFTNISKFDFYANICMSIFVLGITIRFIDKSIVWIKNSYRRRIVEQEIGSVKLNEIMELYRHKSHKKLKFK